MISANVKPNKNNKKWKIWWLYLTHFYKKHLQNLKYNVKRAYIFHLNLVGILSILILSIKNMGRGGRAGLLNRQNMLSVAKVICRQSLNYCKKANNWLKQPANTSNIEQKWGKTNMWVINLILIFNKTNSIPSWSSIPFFENKVSIEGFYLRLMVNRYWWFMHCSSKFNNSFAWPRIMNILCSL